MTKSNSSDCLLFIQPVFSVCLSRFRVAIFCPNNKCQGNFPTGVCDMTCPFAGATGMDGRGGVGVGMRGGGGMVDVTDARSTWRIPLSTPRKNYRKTNKLVSYLCRDRKTTILHAKNCYIISTYYCVASAQNWVVNCSATPDKWFPVIIYYSEMYHTHLLWIS